MEDKVRYKKVFLILNPEDRGFGVGTGASGYVKLEVVEGRGKLTASIQGLKEDPTNFNYKLYMLKCSENQTASVCVGAIPLKKNRGELKWEFSPSSVGSTGIPIDEYNIAAVIAEYKDRQNKEIVCPLAGYKDKKVVWRDRLRNVIYPTKRFEVEPIEQTIQEQGIYSKYSADIESKYVPSQNVNTTPVWYKEPENVSEESVEALKQPDMYYEEDIETGKNDYEMNTYTPPETTREVPENNTVEDISEGIKNSLNFAYGAGEQYAPTQEYYVPTQEHYVPEQEHCAPAQPDRVYAPETPYAPPMPYYFNVPQTQMPDMSKDISGIEKLKANLSKNFESYDPFRNKRSDYEWWKANSPVELNNVMYMSNIRTPLLFNPEVMTAHFKYKHLIVGIYTNKANKKQYMVCGIPGVYGMDGRPFGQMCVWVQQEGNRPAYGTFGYWLAYVDPENGRILSVS